MSDPEIPIEAPADDSQRAAADPALSEDIALALLKKPDLDPGSLEAVGKNGNVMKSRKVKLALVQHPRTPRHVSLPMVRHLFTFDLMKITLTPLVPADIKRAADEALIHRLETISTGERLTLARQGSGAVAGSLLADAESRVMTTALDNPRLTEAAIIRALMRSDSTGHFVEAVCRHAKWSVRREIRIALLRNAKTPMACAVEFARSLPVSIVREILNGSHLPANVQSYIRKDLK